VAIVPTRTWFRVELAHAKAVWPEIRATLEFRMAVLLFVVFTVGLAALGLLSGRFAR